jgi:hypothetical protein
VTIQGVTKLPAKAFRHKMFVTDYLKGDLSISATENAGLIKELCLFCMKYLEEKNSIIKVKQANRKFNV